MLGIKELKGSIQITQTTVECPIKGCSCKVERQRRRFRRDERFKCPLHHIYISPSTFEYPFELDNLLWKNRDDIELFEKIKKVKRESRVFRDNSEDALSWNVFRFLERNHLLTEFLRTIVATTQKSPEVIYWPYSQTEQNSWSELNKARLEFGETIERGSEPDIIVKTESSLFFIEAKLTAQNKTVPSDKSDSKGYVSGGDHWFSKVFKCDYKTIAIDERKYELMRLWLLGTWIAQRNNLDCYLVNLVLSRRERDIKTIFGKHIIETDRRRFDRTVWEDIYRLILSSDLMISRKEEMLEYFRNKTVGYDRNGRIMRAFSVS
jgi:hypothetical protein